MDTQSDDRNQTRREQPLASSGFPGPESLLDRYLRDIRPIPVLAPAAEIQLSSRIQAGEVTLRNIVLAVPLAAREVHRRWVDIREAGRVTATLAATRRADGAPERSDEIDGLLERVGAALSRRDRLTARADFDPAAPTPSLRRIDSELAKALTQVDPRPDLVFDIYCELRRSAERLAKLAGEAGRRRGAGHAAAEQERRRLECEVGLAAAELDARICAAADALDDLADARDTFVHHNVKLVVTVAKDFRNMGVPFLDLIQEGNTGLVRAVEKFDHRKGFRFSTYGVWWIRQSCIRAIQNTSRTVRLPTNVHDRLLRLRRAVSKLDGEPELSEIARAAGEPESEVEALFQYARRPLGLDDPVAGAESLTLGDRLEDESSRPMDEQIDGKSLEEGLPKLLDGLTPRERHIIQWRFGLAGMEEHTLQEIGDEIGLSRERVRQIEREALGKLRSAARKQGLESLVRDELQAA